jgi:hypothetical protein
MADKAPYTYLGGFSFLWVLQVKKEPTSRLEPLTYSVRHNDRTSM